MAKSKSQKLRLHAVRNGQMDPSISRGTVAVMSTHERKLPTLQERRDKQAKKYKQLSHQY